MYVKYSIFIISLYLVGSAISITQNSIIKNMDYLYKSPFWKKLLEIENDCCIMENNIRREVRDLIAISDGKIVNETNFKTKIIQYNTLISYIYNKMLFVICTYSQAIVQKRKNDKKSYEVSLEQLKIFNLVLDMMETTLKLITGYYYSDEKDLKPVMPDNHINLMLHSLKTYRNFKEDNLSLIKGLGFIIYALVNYEIKIRNLTSTNNINEHITNVREESVEDKWSSAKNAINISIITDTDNPGEDITNDIENEVEKILSSGMKKNEIRSQLKIHSNNIATKFKNIIKNMGFKFNTNILLGNSVKVLKPTDT